jgi:hypothetical protein
MPRNASRSSHGPKGCTLRCYSVRQTSVRWALDGFCQIASAQRAQHIAIGNLKGRLLRRLFLLVAIAFLSTTLLASAASDQFHCRNGFPCSIPFRTPSFLVVLCPNVLEPFKARLRCPHPLWFGVAVALKVTANLSKI